jgi:signal transduction histidine kinase/putative methionine-R-sulfoxide reductase with GAF domain
MQSDPPAGNTEPAAAIAGTLVLSLPPDPSRYQKQLEAIMDIAWAVSSTLNVDALLPRIMEKVTAIIKADRSTFFVVDRPNNALWSKVVQGGIPEEIRLGIGEGVAGWVAQSGQTVNLADAHADPRFNRTWDEQSGYRTRSLLCVPVYDRNMSVIAVIQCLNKHGRRGFDDEDEELLRCVSRQCGVALESAFLYEAVVQRNRALQEAEARVRRDNTELEMLYDLERQISESSDPESLVRDILERACSLLKMESAAILLVGESGAQVFAATARAGSAGPLALDPRSARALLSRAQLPTYRAADATGALADAIMPEALGLRLRETFTAPLSDARSTIGMLQLANRLDEGAAEDWLLRMVSLLAGQVTRGIVVKREREAGERAERLALLGHSVGAILHDMRTPMTAVGGYAELMAAENDEATRNEYVARIGRALEHMETMTHEVLAFAKGKRDVLVQKVYMDRFVESVREMLVPETKRYGVQLAINSGYEGVARFDENKIKRVLFNLARNACQAMGAGGTFTWNVQRELESLIFECIDTGPGIPREMEGKLFASFASHGKTDGTGLGLAMAKKIVDAHCGSIECRSLPGQGATFRITLPC